ncbi:hypothetical protein HY988_04545 [Candidatus Micrarchaeota archaeon]|nr:hypothetical protein [Candidatus Micrarchaeota archaeon]
MKHRRLAALGVALATTLYLFHPRLASHREFSRYASQCEDLRSSGIIERELKRWPPEVVARIPKIILEPRDTTDRFRASVPEEVRKELEEVAELDADIHHDKKGKVDRIRLVYGRDGQIEKISIPHEITHDFYEQMQPKDRAAIMGFLQRSDYLGSTLSSFVFDKYVFDDFITVFLGQKMQAEDLVKQFTDLNSTIQKILDAHNSFSSKKPADVAKLKKIFGSKKARTMRHKANSSKTKKEDKKLRKVQEQIRKILDACKNILAARATIQGDVDAFRKDGVAIKLEKLKAYFTRVEEYTKTLEASCARLAILLPKILPKVEISPEACNKITESQNDLVSMYESELFARAMEILFENPNSDQSGGFIDILRPIEIGGKKPFSGIVFTLRSSEPASWATYTMPTVECLIK